MKPKLFNIGIFAHIDAGKTTFVERILYEVGELVSPGNVEEGTTEMDTLPEEIARGISITTSTVHVRYKHKKDVYYFNIVDTPGHLDFHSQVDSALLAIDLAVLLIDVTAGIRSQTEMIAEKLKQREIPVIVFFNKIDRLRTIHLFVDEIKKLFHEFKVCPLFIEHSEKDFEYVFELKQIYEEIELPLIEWSEELSEKYFKLKDPKKVIYQGIKQGFFQRKFIPILAGSALYGEGIKAFLHFLTLLEIPIQESSENIVATIFKKQIHPLLGKIFYLKTHIPIHKGDVLYYGEDSFQIKQLFQIIPGGAQEVEFISSNNIGVIPIQESILENSNISIGQILTNTPRQNLVNEGLFFPKEFSVIVEPVSEEVREKLKIGLDMIVWEDVGLSYSKRLDTGQWELKGIGELHLQVSLKRLEFFVGEIFQIKNFRVAKYGLYKSLAKKVIFEHSVPSKGWKSGKINGFLEARTDFENAVIFECSINAAVKQAIEAAFHEILSYGFYGNPVLGLQLRVVAYEFFATVDEHVLSLVKVSIISGIKPYLENCIGIGPITKIEMVFPHSYTGGVMGILSKRGVRVQSLEVLQDGRSYLRADSASENVLGLLSSIRNITQGKGQVAMDTFFSVNEYSEVPINHLEL